VQSSYENDKDSTGLACGTQVLILTLRRDMDRLRRKSVGATAILTKQAGQCSLGCFWQCVQRRARSTYYAGSPTRGYHNLYVARLYRRQPDEFRPQQSGYALIGRRLSDATLQNQKLTLVGMMPSSILFATWIEISWPLQNMHSARNNISTNFNPRSGRYQEVA
jgi:hypothetical protein